MEKLTKIISVIRDVAIIIGVILFLIWLYLAPVSDEDLYFYEYEDIPEENTGVEV